MVIRRQGTRSAGSLPLKLIRETERTLRLSGITLRSLAQFPDVRPALKEISDRGAEIRILIMDERNPALGSMMNEDLADQALKVAGEIAFWAELLHPEVDAGEAEHAAPVSAHGAQGYRLSAALHE